MRIRIYTDGACSGNPGPGGWAGIILFPQGKQELSGNALETTNNRMELLAVIESLKLAATFLKPGSNDKIDVYSDSAYVVNPVKKGWLHNWSRYGDWLTSAGDPVKNKDLWVKLLKILNVNNNIGFIKVKGHSDNEYNNRCDKLAKAEVIRIK